MKKDYSFFALKDFKFLNVVTNHQVQGKAIGHGYYDGQVQITQRPIEFVIGCFAYSLQERLNKIKELEQLFSVPQNPAFENNGYKDLTFEEPNGKLWEMKAKVTKRATYNDYDNENRVGLTVKLIVESNSCMYSDKHELLDQNRTMGMTLDETLGFPFWYPNAHQINYEGVSDSSMYLTITSLIDNPFPEYLLIRVLRNDGTHTLLRLENINLLQGDIIIIDGFNGKITLNGFDIIGQLKLPFYQFPTLKNLALTGNQTGNNLIAVDCGVANHVLDVKWEWRDTWC